MKHNRYNKYYKILLKTFLCLLVLQTGLMAAVVSGPSNPTANSIPTFFNNKLLTSTDVLIDENNNITGVANLVVTNIVSPFSLLTAASAATNYTINFSTADKQSINATGNVAFLSIENISNGAMKRFYITNVFKATSNIQVLMPTNCLVVTTNSGGPAAIGGGGSTNWVMTVTNDAKLSIECHGTSMRTLVWYLRLLQP